MAGVAVALKSCQFAHPSLARFIQIDASMPLPAITALRAGHQRVLASRRRDFALGKSSGGVEATYRSASGLRGMSGSSRLIDFHDDWRVI